MVQGDQVGASGSSNQGGGGGGKRKNKNKNRNRNKNRQANATNQQPPQQEEKASSPVSVEPSIAIDTPPISLPSPSTETSEVAAAPPQLPIFDSSIGAFRPTANTFLPSYATAPAESSSVEAMMPDMGNLSDDEEVIENPAKGVPNGAGGSLKVREATKNNLKEGSQKDVQNESSQGARVGEEKRNIQLIDNLKVELNSRPDIANWPQIRDAEINLVNTQIENKKNGRKGNGVQPSDDNVEARLRQKNPKLRQTNQTLRKSNSALRNKEWSSGDDEELEAKKAIYNDKKEELIKNIKIEMSNDPYMAYWAQIKDAEHRASSISSKIDRVSAKLMQEKEKPTRGQVKSFNGNQTKVSFHDHEYNMVQK